MTALALRYVALVALVAILAYGVYLEVKGDLSDGALWTLAWVLVVAYVVLSLLPRAEPADPLQLRDKLIHVLSNAVLVAVFLFAAVWRPRRGRGRWPEGAVGVLFAALLVGVGIEGLQGIVGRDVSALDVVANAIGGILGLSVWRLVVARVGEHELATVGSLPSRAAQSQELAFGATDGRGPAQQEARRAEWRDLAFLVTPAAPSLRGAIVEVDDAWRPLPWDESPDADVVIWGRSWLPTHNSVAMAVRFALARERALRRVTRAPAPSRRAVAVHRLPPPTMGVATPRGDIRSLLLGGALVEVARGHRPWRVIDAAATQAGGAGPVSGFTRGAGGAAVAIVRTNGDEGILRVAREQAPGDPSHAADALRFLEAVGGGQTPRLRGRGRCAGASWTLESLLEGRVPRRVDDELVQQLGRTLARLPRTGARPWAPTEDLRRVGFYLPRFTHIVEPAARMVEEGLAGLPGIMRHGDLWAKNILVTRDGLSGIVDWDSWHLSGAPGSDLLYLIVSERWRASRRPMGDLWSERPWRSHQFLEATRAYWHRFDAQPHGPSLEAVGIAAWAAQVSANFGRLPQLVYNKRWVAENAEKLMSYLARSLGVA